MANSKTLNTRIKQKRDTSANWELKNPVLLNGEIIIVDTASGEMRTKTGDGEKTYTQLPFDDEGTKGGKSLVDINKLLTKDNVDEFIPSNEYNPATKKYVDDKVKNSANYIFSDQFKTDENYVAIDGANETVKLDLVDIFNGNSYTVATPSDTEACITYQGDGDTAMLDTGTSTQIISSKSGKLVSLPFGVEYTQGMDVAEYDSVDILSLHKGEYVDKDGKLYTYKNKNALANATSAANFSAMGRDSNKAAIATPVDGLTAICFRRDATGYNAYSAIYNYWKENTDKNGLKYYQFRSTGYGFEKNNGSWSMLTDFIYPSNDGETAFCYASFPDNNGALVTFKPVDYTTFLNTTEENVCAMQYVSASKGVLFFFKPKAEYGYNVDGTTLKVGTTAVNNAWLVIKTREVEYEKTINNKIKTYAGGSLVFIPDENISSYASNPIMDLNTFHYGLEKPAEYTSFNINDIYEGKSGIVKYKVTAGLTQGLGKKTIDTATGGHGIISSARETPFPNVIGTKGVLLSSGGQQIQTEELFGYNDVYEEMTESYYLKKFSDYVTLSGDWLYSVTRIGSSNGALWEFRIPVSELEQTPAYNSSSTSACVLTSSFAVLSEDSIRAIDSFNYATYGMSFTYTESADYIRLLIAQNYLHDGVLQSCKRAVDASQLTFKYLLAKYEYKYNVDKLFIENGERISFNLDDGKTNYKDISLSAPSNNKAAVDMLKPITTNINDLNYKIENIEAVTTVAIGKGDGKTDDTAALQAAINSAKNSNGVVNSVIIPSGHYLISSPLIIATDNVTIRGEGEVVLEASATDYRLPLIVSMANDVTIENLTLKIGYNADDPQYTAGYNRLTDSDPPISHEASQGLHCGIWLDSANTYNSLVNNGEINPYLGYYRNKVKNCTIIGGYRYSVKKTERSYGIYNPDSGFQYFDRIENVNTYNLYCGIRLGDKASSCYVDFHFDSDINNRGGATSINRGGCRFGMISRASYGNIKCYGQSIGGDVMPPIYYDESGNELKMENCPKVRKQLTDISTGNLVEVYTDDGWTDSIMTYPTLSEVGMAIYGRNNYIYNMIYDAQRSSDGLIYFGVNSAYNEVYLPTGTNNDLYGANETTYLNEKYYRKVTVNNVEYYDVVRYDIHFQLFTDLGVHNCRSEKSIENRDYPFVGDMGTWARDDDGSRSNIFAKSYGMQDNFLSFVDRWGTVSVTQGETSITKFDSMDKLGNEIEVSSIGDIFATNSDKLKGFATGLTFKEIPTEENPITIDITFDDRYTAISSGFIQFNDYIAKSYSVALIGVDGIEKNESVVNNNHNAVVYYKPYNISNGSSLPSSTCKGIRIKIYEGMKWTTTDGNGISNPNGKVGISYIFMANANAGGKSYLPLGGGEIYGDLTANVDERTHKLSEKADSIELERIKYYGDKDVIPSPESYFTVNTDGDTVTGLTDEGKTQTELVIPYEINGKKITCITGSESQNNTSVKSIKLPNSIDTIGEMAFWDYTALTSINIPDSVVTINTAAFLGCAVLKSIDIPDSVTTIRDRVFYGCYALTSVKIPKNVTTINDYTFSDCEQLKSLYIPRSVTSIVDTSGHTILSTTTIYCEQGSYAATYAKEVNIPVVYTDIKSTALDNKVDKVEGKSLIDENVASRIQVESSDNSLFVASTDSSVGWKYTPGPERLEYLSPIGSPMTLTYAPAEGFKVVYEYGTPDITVIRSDGTHKLSEKANTSDVLVKNSSGNFVYGGTTISETQVSVMGHNLTNKWEGNVYDINVPVSTWTEMTDTDNQPYYYRKITVSNMVSNGQPMIDIVLSSDIASARKEIEAFQCISRVVTGSGYVELYCFDEAPTTAFTLKILVLGRQLY